MSIVPIPTFDGDLEIIQALDDEPNDVGGLTAAQLKAKFDEGPEALRDYINNTLIPSIRADMIPFTPTTTVTVDTVQEAIENVQEQLVGVVAGDVADGSITPEKLSGMPLRYYRTFSENDWADTHITVPYSEHKLESTCPVCIFRVRMLKGGNMVENTWACMETSAKIDPETKVLQITSPTPFSGDIVVLG